MFVSDFIDVDVAASQMAEWLEANPHRLVEAAQQGWLQFGASIAVQDPLHPMVVTVASPIRATHSARFGMDWTLPLAAESLEILKGDLLVGTLGSGISHLEAQCSGPSPDVLAVDQELARRAVMYSIRYFLRSVAASASGS